MVIQQWAEEDWEKFHYTTWQPPWQGMHCRRNSFFSLCMLMQIKIVLFFLPRKHTALFGCFRQLTRWIRRNFSCPCYKQRTITRCRTGFKINLETLQEQTCVELFRQDSICNQWLVLVILLFTKNLNFENEKSVKIDFLISTLHAKLKKWCLVCNFFVLTFFRRSKTRCVYAHRLRTAARPTALCLFAWWSTDVSLWGSCLPIKSSSSGSFQIWSSNRSKEGLIYSLTVIHLMLLANFSYCSYKVVESSKAFCGNFLNL